MKYVSSCNSYVHYNSISDVVHYYISEPRLSKWPMHAIKYARVKDAFEVQGRPMDFKVTMPYSDQSLRNYHLRNNDPNRILKYPFSNHVPVWSWIFLMHFNQNEVSQKTGRSSRYENPPVSN